MREQNAQQNAFQIAEKWTFVVVVVVVVAVKLINNISFLTSNGEDSECKTTKRNII